MVKLRTSLDELTKAFQNLINDNQKGGSEILDALMELQININKKKDQIELKSSKLQSKSPSANYLSLDLSEPPN